MKYSKLFSHFVYFCPFPIAGLFVHRNGCQSSGSRSSPPCSSNSRHTLNALPENSDEDLSLTLVQTTQPEKNDTTNRENCLPGNTVSSWRDSKARSESPSISVSDSKEQNYSDTDSIVSSSPSRSDFGKDYEPLKSVQLLRNMGKSLSLYLPKHSVGSDSEAENL